MLVKRLMALTLATIALFSAAPPAFATPGPPSGGGAAVIAPDPDGGGICQVSTTIFQAVYGAGLPLEERNWHAIWLPNYGPPNSPTGKKGLDATVDDQAGLDFKFRNTTGGWVAVEATAFVTISCDRRPGRRAAGRGADARRQHPGRQARPAAPHRRHGRRPPPARLRPATCRAAAP